MIDAGSLLEVFGLYCHRCGRADPDAFEAADVLEELLAARRPLTSRVQIMEPCSLYGL